MVSLERRFKPRLEQAKEAGLQRIGMRTEERWQASKPCHSRTKSANKPLFAVTIHPVDHTSRHRQKSRNNEEIVHCTGFGFAFFNLYL